LRLRFAPLTRQEVASYLQSHRGMNGADAEFIAALAMGSLGAALALDKAELAEKRRNWSRMLGALKARDYQGAMETAETLAGNREEALEFLKWAESWYRDLLNYSVAGESDALVNLDMERDIAQQSAQWGTEAALGALGQIATAAARIQRNLNRRMVLEKLLFGVVGGR
jgi:DNA polymerase-3 subunit delta'